MVMHASIDARDLQKALRTLAPEIAKGTSKRMRDLAREVRDDTRRQMERGPGKGGHMSKAITSGASGVVPYVSADFHSARYPYLGWRTFGGRRPNDTTTHPVVQGGRWFYPTVAKARAQLLRDVERITGDAIVRVGLD